MSDIKNIKTSLECKLNTLLNERDESENLKQIKQKQNQRRDLLIEIEDLRDIEDLRLKEISDIVDLLVDLKAYENLLESCAECLENV